MNAESSSSLTIAVCVKYSVDVEGVRIDADTRAPDFTHAARRISDFDENAIEAALRLRDEHGGRVLAVSAVADRPPGHTLLQALAMGADELHLACDETMRHCDAYATAEVLAALIRGLGAIDLVICGDASADENRGEVGPRLGEALGIPSVTHVTRLEFSGGRLLADRALETCVESVEVVPPALVTVGSETNEPRLSTLRGIMLAGKKPVTERSLADLAVPEICGDGARRTRTLTTYAPFSARRRLAITGDSPAERARRLVRHLQGDAAIEV
jgi:electron transfer flavoprotein beta subunit